MSSECRGCGDELSRCRRESCTTCCYCERPLAYEKSELMLDVLGAHEIRTVINPRFVAAVQEVEDPEKCLVYMADGSCFEVPMSPDAVKPFVERYLK